MAKLEELLKSKGYTDADLTGMAAILSDQRLRNTLEASFNEVATERDTYKQRDEEWQQNLDTQYTPAIARAEQDAHKARMEAAEVREQLKIAKEYGYLPEGDAQARADAAAAAVRNAANPQGGNQGFNPDDPKFREFANRFSMGEGDAMALYNYVAEEYRLLNGGSLNDYTGRDGKRGMLALRAEALAAKKPIDQYANEKFNWDGKRAEQQAARRKAEDDEVARKAVEVWALEHGTNPMTQRASPSRMPLMPTKVNDGKPVQPWDRPMATAERRQRAYETETRSRVN